MDNTGLCFVKYTFPREIDISGIDLNYTIDGRGLFIQEDGTPRTFSGRYMVNKYNLEERWIYLKGCEFNPEGKSEEQLQYFIQDYFEVTFKGLINPPTKEVSPLKIEVFKYLEPVSNELGELFTQTTNFVISMYDKATPGTIDGVWTGSYEIFE